MKIDVGKIALVVVLIAGVQTTTLYHRINDLECQRDIYKSRYEDWEGVSKEIAGYADTLRGFAESAGPVGWKVASRGCRRLPLHGILHRKAGAHLWNRNRNYRQRRAG